MRRLLAIVVLAVLGASVWIVGAWVRTWVLGVEAPVLYATVAGAALLLPALAAAILRFVFEKPKLSSGFAGATILLNGGAIAALLLAPPSPPSGAAPPPSAPPPERAPPPAPVEVSAEVELPVPDPAPAGPRDERARKKPPPADTFYRYELDGEMHVVSRIEDVPVALRSKAVPMTMARTEPDEAAPPPEPRDRDEPPPPLEASPRAARVAARVGDHRVDAGLSRVVLDPEKTRGAQQHADYIALNIDHPSARGLGLHGERRSLPGWTVEGARAGRRAVIAVQRGVPLDPVDQWMGTFFHRIPLVHPGLRSVGVGYAERGDRRIYVVDPFTAEKRTSVVIVPADGATNVPRAFSGDELPNPIPQDADGSAGYPITVSFPSGARVQDVRVELTSVGRGFIPVWTSTPESPVVVGSQQNTVCVMAKDPLGALEKYRFSITARVGGRVFSKRSTFTTER